MAHTDVFQLPRDTGLLGSHHSAPPSPCSSDCRKPAPVKVSGQPTNQTAHRDPHICSLGGPGPPGRKVTLVGQFRLTGCARCRPHLDGALPYPPVFPGTPSAILPNPPLPPQGLCTSSCLPGSPFLPLFVLLPLLQPKP